MRRHKGAVWLGAALLAAILAAWALWPARGGRMTLTVLDVGQGDAAVIETPDGHVMVVDAGPASAVSDAGRRVVLPFLWSRGYNGIDWLVLTHPDEDHIGGAATLLARLGVRRVASNGAPCPTAACGGLNRAAAARGTPVYTVKRGDRLVLGREVTVDVLSPTSAGPGAAGDAGTNRDSLVLLVRYGGTRVLLMGDADAASEAEIARSYPTLRADVLKVGHHGSRSSTSGAWLDQVRPAVAVISVGRDNRFGHPSEEVLARLAARRMTVYRTDRSGAVTLESDGRSVRVRTMERGRAGNFGRIQP